MARFREEKHHLHTALSAPRICAEGAAAARKKHLGGANQRRRLQPTQRRTRKLATRNARSRS
eukprot:3934135-Rhodomonas_salina.4